MDEQTTSTTITTASLGFFINWPVFPRDHFRLGHSLAKYPEEIVCTLPMLVQDSFSVGPDALPAWCGKWWWLCCTQTGSWGQRGMEMQRKDVKNLLYSRSLLIMPYLSQNQHSVKALRAENTSDVLNIIVVYYIYYTTAQPFSHLATGLDSD